MPELIKKLIRKYPYSAVFLIAVIAWLPVVLVPFINDDFQILGYHTGKGWISLLRPFYSPDVSNFYWRPLGNVLHPLILLTAGFHPFAFRIASLILYAVCCILAAKAGEKLGISRTFAVSGAILFAVLPSHEYQAAWIADHGESLVTIVLLTAFFSYLNAFKKDNLKVKSMAPFYFLLLLAALIKESAFAGVLIPVIALTGESNSGKRKVLIALRDSAAGVAVIVGILLFRWYFIGGTPFSSNHFGHSGIFRWILNFFIYIPLSFLSPESLEIAAGTPGILRAVLAIALIIIAFAIFILRKHVKFDQPAVRRLAAALLWFIVFILPGLPNLMRWYVFTASVGLIWVVAAAAEMVEKNSFARKALMVIFMILIPAAAVYDFSLMLRWGSVGKRVDLALKSLNNFSGELKADSVYVWATPDKLTRIPMMKLGVQESVQWALKNKNISVLTPLRSEMSSCESRIELVEKTDTSLVFHIAGGRFLPYGGESRAVVKNESTETSDGTVRLKIKTFLNENNVPQSIAGVYFRKPLAKPQLYFDGKEFRKTE